MRRAGNRRPRLMIVFDRTRLTGLLASVNKRDRATGSAYMYQRGVSLIFSHPIGDGDELRLLEVSDAEQVFSLMDDSRRELREWLAWVDGTQEQEQTVDFIKQGLSRFADNNGFEAGIWHQDQLAGVIGLYYINWIHGHTAIGYWLGTQFWGRGLMTRAVRSVVDHLVFGWGLQRIEIKCAEQNKRSRAVPERLGFKQEGILRRSEKVGGRLLDIVVYGMLSDEWDQ